ncbi:hypothetical protein HCN44_011498 [Aphidius gifuensis]|uniref:Membrane insertase YidC/Oxa/ALB C-terminal domain-containing protein n=1 Tax=Aphidius gifuensis TaxID=684658 RepID=A0A835CJS4_APHGI|nr:cytochrome c oxidase assembly protein COX18, mitochondrial-like [Aphidius gifuensis]KAF7987164.1 hypothetical protein HCN44_011498 [Aphidius gifuensis]
MYCQFSNVTATVTKIKSLDFYLISNAKGISRTYQTTIRCCLHSLNRLHDYKQQSFQLRNNKSAIRVSGVLKKITLLNHKNYGHLQLSRNFSDFPTQQAPIVKVDGFLKVLVDSAPVEFCQNSFIWLHSYSGLPWWATIMVTTFALRSLITLPCALYQHNILSKTALLKYDMEDIVKDLKREANFRVQQLGWTETRARHIYNRSVKKEWNKLIVRDNCHPMKSLVLVLVQVPIWVIVSAGLRNICFMLPSQTPRAVKAYQDLSLEGFWWIADLTAVDSYWILPVSLGITSLINIEIQAMLRITESSRMQNVLVNLLRAVSLFTIPLAAMVPSCLSLYWVTSSTFSILQTLLIVSPKVRRTCHIPVTDNELKHPYRSLYNSMKRRIIHNKT